MLEHKYDDLLESFCVKDCKSTTHNVGKKYSAQTIGNAVGMKPQRPIVKCLYKKLERWHAIDWDTSCCMNDCKYCWNTTTTTY